MKKPKWWWRLRIDDFWRGWHNRFRREKDRFITPKDTYVQNAVRSFDWSQIESDKEKALKSWEFVWKNVRYRLSAKWYTPRQTIKNGMGDCEDVTFLLSSMFIEMGVSNHKIKTGLIIRPNGRAGEHVWNEVGNMVVDATGRPVDVSQHRYESNWEYKFG